MPITTARTATNCPTPIACTAAALGAPAAPFTTAQTYPPPGTSTVFNQAAAALRIIGQSGSGGYGIISGLVLADGGGLLLSVGVGIGRVDGIIELVASGAVGTAPFNQVNVPAAITLAASQTNYVWLTQTGALVSDTTKTYPAGAKIFLGTVTTSGSAITNIDNAGVITLSGGKALRITADLGAPTDSPSSTLLLFTKTAGGMYVWDGYAHRYLATNAMRTLFAYSATVSNTSTSETDLFTDSVAVNTLIADKDRIVAEYAGTIATTGGNKRLRVYFGGTGIYDSTALAITTTTSWVIHVTIMRTGSSTARAIVRAFSGDSHLVANVTQTDLTGLDFTATNIIKITGTGGASTDISAKFGSVEYHPAP